MVQEDEVVSGRVSHKAEEIGKRIIQARKEAGGMRQEELADLIHVSIRSMQAYESGEVIPYRKMRDLERALGRSAAWILHGDDSAEGRDQQLAEIKLALEELREVNRVTMDGIREVNTQILAELRRARGAE
jgi:transcriptional regulator with XRE-family HTH domain